MTRKLYTFHRGDQEEPAGLIAAVVTEKQIVLRLMGAVQPAHHVHTHLVGGFVELDGIAPALVHGAPVLRQQGGVTEVLQEGRAAVDHGCHRQQAVEPVAELSGKGLADPVSRVPVAPVIRIGAVAQGAERNDPGIQPGIAHIRDAVHDAVALPDIPA